MRLETKLTHVEKAIYVLQIEQNTIMSKIKQCEDKIDALDAGEKF
jgi:hypothetical protein